MILSHRVHKEQVYVVLSLTITLLMALLAILSPLRVLLDTFQALLVRMERLNSTLVLERYVTGFIIMVILIKTQSL